ncbi:MAG: ABC transporter substrate-binding protein [Alphaproteobacteria bacterium]|nr:ABC transporter substrate-binding protein [Alphaproteobacteria bacterium]
MTQSLPASPRRALFARAGLGLGALALLALAHLPAGAQEQPRRGGTLVYGVAAEPPNYDCHANSTYAVMHVVSPHYSRLLRFKSDRYPEIEGDLAESWQVAPDGMTYTFRIREGVRFHDGTALSSADIKASFERIANPPQGVVSVRKADFEDLGAIEAPDARTVVFRLKAANASFLTLLASPWHCIYSAARLAADPAFPVRNVMGSGPFRFVEHQRGNHWIGARFDNYHEAGRPYLDGFRAVFVSGPAMINALQAGQIMAEFRGMSPAERDRLRASASDRLVINESPWICKLDLYQNARKAPFDDARVRRALVLALDRWRGAEFLARQTYVRGVSDFLRPGSEFALPESELEKLPGYGRDIAAARAEARRLLAEAGHPNLRFRLQTRNTPPYVPMAVWLIDQWRQIGVTVENNTLDVGQLRQAITAAQFDVILEGACVDVDEPNAMLLRYLSADKSPLNYAHYVDRTLDDLFDRQKRVTDVAQRRALINDFNRRVLSEAYAQPVLWWHRIVAHSNKLRGWHMTPSHFVNQDFANVWLAE